MEDQQKCFISYRNQINKKNYDAELIFSKFYKNRNIFYPLFYYEDPMLMCIQVSFIAQVHLWL